MMTFESDLAPLSNVTVLPTGTPDQLDVWYAVRDVQPEHEDEDPFYDEEGPYLSDADADAMTLASAGWGTDEDYGSFEPDFAEPPF